MAVFADGPALAAAVAGEVNRADSDPVIRQWIGWAEDELERKLYMREGIARDTCVFDDGAWQTMPSDYREMISVHFNSEHGPKTLTMASIGEINDIRARYPHALHPTNFAIIGNQMVIAPYSGATAQIEMVYNTILPRLTFEAGQSTWLLNKASDALFYAALVHSAPYLMEDDRVQTWAGLANSCLDALNTAADRAAHAGGRKAYRITPYGGRTSPYR